MSEFSFAVGNNEAKIKPMVGSEHIVVVDSPENIIQFDVITEE
jgi:hypothetical protein